MSSSEEPTGHRRGGMVAGPDGVTEISPPGVVVSVPLTLVRMHVTSGFPFWEGSTWEWELGAATRSPSGTGVLFRHYGFGEGYPEIDLAHTAHTWALIMDRLATYVTTGTPAPFFPEEPTDAG